MKDSEWAFSSFGDATETIRPLLSRFTEMIGWTVMCTDMLWRLMQLETESTRNGMSSLTISMNE